MKRFITALAVFVCLITLSLTVPSVETDTAKAPTTTTQQDFCIDADNGESWVLINGSTAQFRACDNLGLPFDGLSIKKGTTTISGDTLSYIGTRNEFTLTVTASVIDGTGTVQIFQSGTLIYSFTRNDQTSSECVCE